MKPSRRWFAPLCALLCLCALLAAGARPAAVAQEEEEKKKKKEQPAAGQRLTVKLNALVLDAQDRLVGDLRLEDFQLLEDGVPQKISVFEKQEGPHAFGLVVDNSGSMRRDLDQVVEFGRMIVDGTGADSRGFVVRFVDSDKIQIMQDVTASKPALARALDEMFIEGGQTAINDAVYLAADRLAAYKGQQAAPLRYSLILVTDGEDRGSYYKDAKLFEKLRGSGLRVFVVGFVQDWYQASSPEKARQYMNRLAFESGGSAYFVKKGGELPQAARLLLAEMSANYVIGYDSTNTKRDGSTRKVRLTAGGGAAGETRKVLVKESYVAPGK